MKNIKSGNNAPEDINVLIEIPMNSDPIKYEIDKDSGMLLVDRICATPMFYPCNYGFIPNSLGGDGDPLDALVICRYPLLAGSVINCRPIGVLVMEDESGMDEKIIAVPNNKITKYYDNVKDIADIPTSLLSEIKHFFEHYKDLDANKWVKIQSIQGLAEAKNIISQSIK